MISESTDMTNKLFDFLGRIFRTDFRYLAKGGSTLSIMHITSAVVSFVLTIAFANLVPPETYGVYRYVLSVYAFLGVLVLPGIDTAIIRAVSRGFEGSLMEGFKRKLRWGTLGSIASFGVAIYNYVGGETMLATIFFFVALIIPVMEATSVYSPFMNGKKLYKPWMIMDVATLIISGAILATTLFLTDNVFLIVLAYFIPLVLLRLFFLYKTKRRFVDNQKIDPELVPYGKQITIFQIITRAISSIDQIVLFHFLGPVQLAIFSLAVAIPNRAQGLLRIAGTLATPKFAVQDPKEIARSLWRKMWYFSLFIIFWAIVYVLIAPWLFQVLFPKYIESVPFSQVLIFFSLSAITYPISSLLFAHKKMKENYIISIGSISAKIISLAIFVPIFGVWGGVISILSASLSTIVISLILLRKISKSSTIATT